MSCLSTVFSGNRCECLEGNADEAKRLIGEPLKKHPEKKENALKDEDFAAIRDWIRNL
ncbi:MAG: hypothetical protein P8Q54_13555 [Akkermansiaceae bacterium]|nr:hypothetical protein [Akkermansiaceae bacterium]